MIQQVLIVEAWTCEKVSIFIAFRKVLGVGLKQHPWRYWISYVFVLSLVIIAWARCLNGLDMGVSHNPYVLFLCPFNISFLYLIILILFLYKMEMQSLSHIFDGLHSALLISLGQLCDDDCIAILYKNGINILKYSKLILKRHRNKTYGLWDTPISRPLIHWSHTVITGDNKKTELIQYLHGCCFSPTSRNFWSR